MGGMNAVRRFFFFLYAIIFDHILSCVIETSYTSKQFLHDKCYYHSHRSALNLLLLLFNSYDFCGAVSFNS